jgi:hypothetical protein
MPPRDLEKDSLALRKFKRKKVLLVEELAELLASSTATARRRLKQWHTYTSYNHNGRYYVLHGVAKFDPNGLWRYRTIFFSQHGNLKNTVIHLVQSSPAGLTGTEIGELVEIAPRSFLSHFRNELQLQRETIEGRFVYFSSDRAARIKQMQKRQEEAARAALIRFPTDAEAVDILVERIKHPHLSIEDFSIRLRRKGHRFSVEELRNFLGHRGLLKKTQDTQR